MPPSLAPTSPASSPTPSKSDARPRRGCLYRLARNSAIALVVLAALSQYLFPGQRTLMAGVLGTGLGKGWLQPRIDALEDKAIHRRPFTEDDKDFLRDLYSTLATGGKLTIIIGQTGRMMDHYLNGAGEDYALEPEIFKDNKKVQRQMKILARRAKGRSCAKPVTLSSKTFYMPDKSQLDSVFGLYHGRLHLTLEPGPGGSGSCVRRWRAEVPWEWPSYASLKKKRGDPHAESFPLPNAMVLVKGRRASIFIDNGLGEYLAQLGLATPFLAYGEWSEGGR